MSLDTAAAVGGEASGRCHNPIVPRPAALGHSPAGIHTLCPLSAKPKSKPPCTGSMLSHTWTFLVLHIYIDVVYTASAAVCCASVMSIFSPLKILKLASFSQLWLFLLTFFFFFLICRREYFRK